MKCEFVAVILALIIGSGCESTNTSLHSQLEISGVSLTELFSPPTSIELSQIQTTWSQRDLVPRDIEEVYREILPDGRLIRVVSHTGTGGKHFGTIISPADGTPVPPRGFPIGLSLAGFGPPFEVNVDTNAPRDSGQPAIITVTPAFRGHRLIVGDNSYESEGPLFDQCDGGTDDILAFLNVAIEVTPGAGEQVVAVGGSRGGNTAMLASIRDDRVKRVVSLAGPDTYLIDSYIDHPNIKILYENWFLKDLAANGKSIADARERMISCSPLYFIQDMAPTQLHHGTADAAVPFAVLDRMQQAWIDLGRDPVELETYVYDGSDHTFNGLYDQIRTRVNAFILPVL